MRFTLSKRRVIAAVALTITIMVSLAANVFATTLTDVLDGQISITDTQNTISHNNGTVTATAKGGMLSKKTNTVTITNETNSTATLTFSYTVTSASSFTIDGESASTSGSVERELGPGSSVVLAAKSKSGFSDLTVTLTMKDFSLTALAAQCTVTYFGAEGVSYTLGGKTLGSSSDSVTTEIDTGNSITLPAAPTVSNGTFAGWRLGHDGSLRAAGETVTIKKDTSVYPVIIAEGQVAPFTVGGVTYNFWSEAVFAAGTNGTIILNQNYTLPTTMTANGVSPNGSAYVTGTDGNVNYVLPSGVTLLVPRDASDTGSYAKTETTGTKAAAFRTLTIAEGTTLTIKGTLINNATISSAQGGKAHSGEVTGTYGRITNNGTLIIASGATWQCRGYTDGDGLAMIKNGGKLYQPMVVQDWRGGGATTGVASKVFPLNVYSMINVMCHTRYEYGSALYVVAQLKVTLNVLDEVEAQVLGTADGCIFQMTEGCVVESKFNKSERKMEYSATAGTLNLAYMDVSVSIYSMSSKNTVVPFNDMFIINVENGATVNVTYAAKLLPGSVLNVKDGGTLNVTGSLYIYRGNDFAVTYANSQYFALPNNDIFSNAARYSSLAGVNAQVNVYGTGKITGNIYVSSKTGDISGVVHCINGGTFSTSATANTTINEHVSTSESIETVDFTPANGHAVHATTNLTAPNFANGGIKYNDTVIAPTCNVVGYTKHQCSVCDYSYNDTEVNALGHSYEDNSVICTVCGLFEFYASNVHLGNSLDMMFAFPAAAFPVDADLGGYYVKVVRTYADSSPVESKIYASSWSSTKINNVDYYVVIYKGFAAKEMCDSVSLTVCRETTSKEEELSTVWTDSIQQYAMRMLSNHSDNQTLCTLLVDMLNYGAACQKHFAAQENKDIADDGLANAKLSDDQKGWATDVVNLENIPEVSPSNGANLIVDSNIRFVISGADSQSSYTFMNHWEKETSLRSGNFLKNITGDVYYYISKLYVADARQTITITIGNAVYTDSIAAYCKRMIDGKQDTNGVFTAFMKFSDSAYNYLHDEEGRV